MKNISRLLGMLLLPLSLVILFNILPVYKYLGINSLSSYEYQLVILAISGFIFIGIFNKYVRARNLIQSFSIQTVITALILSIFLWFVSILIEGFGSNFEILEKQHFSTLYIVMAIIICLVVEELVFRIIIINRFKNLLPPFLLVLSTSTFFALFHIRDIYLILSTLLFGVVLATLYVKKQNGALLVLTHILFNTLYILLNSCWIELHKSIFKMYSSIFHYIIVISGFLIFIYLISRQGKKN